jgi:hypothetical protein
LRPVRGLTAMDKALAAVNVMILLHVIEHESLVMSAAPPWTHC